MTVQNLIEALQRIKNQEAEVIVNGEGPMWTLLEQLGANEPFVVLQSRLLAPGLCGCEAYPSGHRHMPDGTLDV
jgi:hypothetical protein